MRDQRARRALRAPQTFTEWTIADCERSIHERFGQQVKSTPDAPAVSLVSGDVTYAQLNRDSDRAARAVREAVGPDSRPVALLCPQGYESIVWTLGVLKSGLPYAPLDQRLPTSNLRRMIDFLDPSALLAAEAHLELGRTLAANRIPVIAAHDALRNGGQETAEWTHRRADSEDVAYIFYTSGSTGIPKGVADTHRNVLHNVLRYTNTLRFGAGDRLSLVQNPSFSGTVSTLFGALLNGATVVPFDLQGDGLSSLSAWARRMRITVFHAVPSIFRMLSDEVDRFPDLRLVRLEGDRTSGFDLEHFRSNCQPSCTLVNGLGATECGLVRQYFVDVQAAANAEQLVPIGYAVPDVEVRLLDEHGHAPIGDAPGELVVDSRFLAKGYWRNPDLTRQRFEDLGHGVRRYRTGDLGRLQSDGCLVHLGRIDHRIRIAGEFVDAAEIEALLTSQPGVRQAVVHDYVDAAGERRLCAYLVRDQSTAVSVNDLRELLGARVGEHASPSAFILMDQFPLTKDLKVDRRRLPKPGRERPRLSNEYEPPRTAQEEQIAQVWSEVLEIDRVGVTDSLLALGGDSLRAARIVGRLRPTYGDRIRITTVFEHPTVRTLTRALGSVEESHTRDSPTGDQHAIDDHRIAIIGMAARLPGADSIDEFWQNLRAGLESVTFFEAREVEATAGAGGPTSVCARGMLADVDRFDAPLFKLTPRQAQMLDPQQRVWLECVHHALEDAGIPISPEDRVATHIGVFAGGRESTYLWHLLGGRQPSVDALLNGSSDDALELLNGNDRDSIATRTSFVFGLTGPSVNVQSACSTSLVAVAQACQALVAGQCDVAIAGGVTVTFPQKRGYRHESGGMYSRDGHCRAFDAQASGTTFSDGAGAVILKRLDRALDDGDRIDAVVRGWAVNNDGASKASFAAPNIHGQVRVIVQAQRHAGVRPQDVSYVEAHGTGTPVGDPIEFAALERAFRREGNHGSGVCGLGSVKTNIGHVDAAAGIAGLIKTVLSLKHRELPPTLHFQSANPEIALESSPFYVVNQLTPWDVTANTRIAGVSSLGVGGTNCHVILEEAPRDQLSEGTSCVSLVTLSAATPDALDALEARFERLANDESSPELARIARTTQQNRSHRRHRTAIRCSARTELRDGLANRKSQWHSQESPATYRRWNGRASDDLSIGFLFSGQGAQYAGMGRELYDANADFRGLLDRCDEVLRGRLDRSLLDVMFGLSDVAIDRTEFAQPALFALGYSIAELLRRWGIRPAFVMGHSIGEYVAACVAGVFSFEEGLALTAERGRLMQHTPGTGRMMAVTAPADTIQEWLGPVASEVSIAAFNSPFQTVLSGEAAAIERLETGLRSRGIHTRVLTVSHAFHSAQMTPVLAPLQQLVAQWSLQPPRIPLVSNLSGQLASTEITEPGYWSDHARQPVQFAAGIRSLITAGCDVLIEIGPDSLLSHLVTDNDPGRHLATVATLQRGEQGWAAMLDTLGQLYVHGARVDWPAVDGGRRVPPARLPGYVFQRTRHWYEGPLTSIQSSNAVPDGSHPLLGTRLRLPGSDEIRFEAQFSQTRPHYLADHRLFGISLPPGASHFAMLAQASDVIGNASGRRRFRFDALYLLRPLLLPDGYKRTVQLIFRPSAQGWELELTSALVGESDLSKLDWTTHMVGRGHDVHHAVEPVAAPSWDLDAMRATCGRTLSGAEFYSRIWANHGGTGSSFRWIESIWQGDRVAFCRAVRPPAVTDAAKYRLHPGLVEAACQVLHCCGEIETAAGLEATGATYVPFSVDTFALSGAAATHDEAWCHAELRELTPENVIADLTILSATGQVVAQLKGFCLRQITRDAVTSQSLSRASERLAAPDVRAIEPTPSAALTAEEAAAYLRRKCAELAGHVESELRLDVGFAALGLDSIAALRLSNHVLRDLGRSVGLGQILTCRSLAALAQSIAAADAEPIDQRDEAELIGRNARQSRDSMDSNPG